MNRLFSHCLSTIPDVYANDCTIDETVCKRLYEYRKSRIKVSSQHPGLLIGNFEKRRVMYEILLEIIWAKEPMTRY